MSVVAGEPMPAALSAAAQRLDARAGAIVRLADPEDVAVGHFVLDHARLDHVVGRAHDGAHHAVQADRLGERAARVETAEIGRRRARLGKPVAVPPGNAVLHEGDGGVGAEQGPDVAGKRVLARGLQRHQHGVLRPEIGRPVGRLHLGHDLPVAGQQGEPARPDRLEMRAARHDRDLVAGVSQSRREIAADGACPVYANPHAPLSAPAVGLPPTRRKQAWPTVNIAD